MPTSVYGSPKATLGDFGSDKENQDPEDDVDASSDSTSSELSFR